MEKEEKPNFNIRLVKCGDVEPIDVEKLIEDMFYIMLLDAKEERENGKENRKTKANRKAR